MEVTMYSTKLCAACHMLTKWLEDKSVDYTKKLVDEDEQAMEEFMSLNDGAIGVPFTVITNESGVHKITGFDNARLGECLALG